MIDTAGRVVAQADANERPWRTVLAAFVVSRLLLVPAIVGAYQFLKYRHRTANYTGIFNYDFDWYRAIAAQGYGLSPTPHEQSRWPFFPLYPWLVRGTTALGFSQRFAAILLSTIPLIIALFGVYKLARMYASSPVARTSVWLTALFPFSFVFSMGYPSAIVCAATTWALIFIAKRNWYAASALCLVLTAIRPNGLIVPCAIDFALAANAWNRASSSKLESSSNVAIVVTPTLAKRATAFLKTTLSPGLLLVVPSLTFVLVWMVLNDKWTGSPFTFWTAKAGWIELTLKGVLLFESPTGMPHVLAGYVGLFLLFWVWRNASRYRPFCKGEIPLVWLLVPVAYIGPSIIFGNQGLGRYAVEMAPVMICSAIFLHAKLPKLRLPGLILSGLAMIGVATAVFAGTYVP